MVPLDVMSSDSDVFSNGRGMISPRREICTKLVKVKKNSFLILCLNGYDVAIFGRCLTTPYFYRTCGKHVK